MQSEDDPVLTRDTIAPSPAAEVSDQKLVGQFREGKKEAFELLFDRYQQRVYDLALRLTGNSQDAEDIAQEAFLRALRGMRSLKQSDTFRPWLYQITTNLSLDTLRQRKRKGTLGQEELPELVDQARYRDPQKSLEINETRQLVQRAVNALPTNYRLVLSLREAQGLNYADIAVTMKTTVSAVETLLFRARKQLKKEYMKLMIAPRPTYGECARISPMLSAYLDRELSPQGQGRVESHLAGCFGCQATLTELKTAKSLYQMIPLAVVPAGLKAGFMVKAAELMAGATVGASAGSAGLAGKIAVALKGKAGIAIASLAAATITGGALVATDPNLQAQIREFLPGRQVQQASPSPEAPKPTVSIPIETSPTPSTHLPPGTIPVTPFRTGWPEETPAFMYSPGAMGYPTGGPSPTGGTPMAPATATATPSPIVAPTASLTATPLAPQPTATSRTGPGTTPGTPPTGSAQW